MPNLYNRPPKYRRKADGRGCVVLHGYEITLGKYDTPEGWERYHRIVNAYLANGRRLPAEFLPQRQRAAAAAAPPCVKAQRDSFTIPSPASRWRLPVTPFAAPGARDLLAMSPSDPIWTPEQVLALAPDASSAKAGRACTARAKWVTLDRSLGALWGEFQGSGSKPYQTQVDLSGPAFKCSCPSRKFPCKHGLGAMLLLAERPADIPLAEPPPWVAEWLAGRSARGQKRESVGQAEPKPVDTAAQERRVAAREARVAAGLEELSAFLQDVLRQGLAAVAAKPAEFFEKPAARLIDAQAPGLARMVRRMSELSAGGEGWQSRLLSEIGRVYLIIEAYRRLEVLAPEAQAELRSLVGWTTPQEEVLEQPGVQGRWVVAAQSIEQEQSLTTQRTYLIERDNGRRALVLNFAAGGARLDTSLVVGMELEAELAFFPAATPLRALIKARSGTPAAATRFAGAGIEAALAEYSGALASSPWLVEYPLTLSSVVPMRESGRWFLGETGEESAALSIDPRFAGVWELLAVSGGRGIGVLGEWNGVTLRPLAASAEGDFVRLSRTAEAA